MLFPEIYIPQNWANETNVWDRYRYTFMDCGYGFSTPDAILSEMKSVLSQSIHIGYNMDYPGWKEAIIYWYKKRYDCQIKSGYILFRE